MPLKLDVLIFLWHCQALPTSSYSDTELSRPMHRFRRTTFLFLLIGESPVVDAGAFLRGELKVTTESHIEALSILTGEKQRISAAQLDLISRFSARSWSTASKVDGDPALAEASLEEMARSGWLLSDADDPHLQALLRCDEILRSQQWHPLAALYHFMSRERNLPPVDLEALAKNARSDAEALVKKHGPPPEPFHRVSGAGPSVELPLMDKNGAFYEALTHRRTVRAFDSTRSMTFQDLATLLQYTFGCQGYVDLAPQTVMVHKTSPSGGSLHPIEAYPLILNVEGVPTGLYHYNIHDHALVPLRQFDHAEAVKLATDFAHGQLYAGSAHALIVMTARFFRNYWKYRRRSRTYGVILMDAGHLSQTFYLVAAELGLGAFYSASVDGPRIEEELGIEPQEEGALAICGCGLRKKDGADLGLAFEPFSYGKRSSDP